MSVGEHLADHVPSYLDVSIFDEMKRYVHVVFFKSILKTGFVYSNAVKAGFGGKARVTFRVLKKHLNFLVNAKQVLGAREDNFENMLIKIADREVKVK